MGKTQITQNFCAPRLSWYSFRSIWRPIQPSHLKNHEFHFFAKLPTKPSSYVVVHRQTWPWAKPNQIKTFVHQDFHGIHLGAFGSQSNPHISKTTNFIFSQNSPPSHLPMPWPCAKPSELKTWYSFGDIWRRFQPSHLKNHEFHFFTKLHTKHSSYIVVHRQPWPCAKPFELKTFVRQEFHGIQLGTFGGLSNTHISRISFFHKPPHLAI